MYKKGQVTLFVIIAIVIVGAVAGYFILRGEKIIDESHAFDVSSVKNYVDECIREIGEEVIFEVSEGGGYYLPPRNSLSSGIPIYYYNGEDFSPSLEDIEDEISFFISENLFFCTKNFVDFPMFDINQGIIEVTTKVFEDEVLVDVFYPITISGSEGVVRLEEFFGFNFDYRLGEIYDVVSEYMKIQSNTNLICLTCLYDIAETNDLYISVFDGKEGDKIFILEDRNKNVENDYLNFPFAVGGVNEK